MCNCRSELEKADSWHSDKGKIMSCSIDSGIALKEKPPVVITTSRMKIYIEGKAKPLIHDIAHTFCPWCGERYIPVAETQEGGEG